MRDLWKFSKIPCIEESTFHKVLERFYDSGVSGLVRENIQNSLDGKEPTAKGPVRVIINMGSVPKEVIPGLEEIKERISVLQGRNNYTKEAVAHMKNKMEADEVKYISFEDSNTKGLSGAKNGQSNSLKDTWGVYAYNKGVHTEEENSDLEKSRGGSHGIGKIASNAASELHMMYFANCDIEGDQHLGGTVQLIEHQYEDSYYRSTGYFTDQKLENNTYKFYPYTNNFDKVFSKNTRGLKIIIPFLREQFNDEAEVLRSVCDSFFVAILQEKLEVIINHHTLNKDTINRYICDKQYYEQDITQIKDIFTPLYFQTYSHRESTPIFISDKKKDYHFNLYFNYDQNINKGRVAIIRTIGMKIEDRKIKNNVNKPFNAVLIPASITEDAFLKSLENESHTELSYEHIKDQMLQKNAKKFINNIDKIIKQIIDNEIKKNNPTDGRMDTADVLYEVQNQFKKELLQSMETVDISQGNKKKTVVKIKDEKEKKDKKSKNGIPRNETGLKKERKPKKRQDTDEDRDREKFKAHPNIVNRVIIGNKEYLRFDFTSSPEAGKASDCNVTMSIIDGMGVEYANEFNIENNYVHIVDKHTGKILMVKDNRILDVTINKGVVNIELEVTKQFNKALKFVYYVEV